MVRVAWMTPVYRPPPPPPSAAADAGESGGDGPVVRLALLLLAADAVIDAVVDGEEALFRGCICSLVRKTSCG